MRQSLTANGLNGWHVLFAIVGFFATVMAVDGVLIYKAVSTFAGDTADSYRIGLAYNTRIDEERLQDSLGWTEANTYDAAGGVFTVTLKGPDGRGIDGLNVIATIGRPATDISDRDVVLTASGDGIYRSPVLNLSEGTWEVSLAAKQGDAKHQSVVYRSKARLWKQP